MSFRMTIAAAATLLLVGCTIADVTVPPSEDLLVVEAVLRTDFLRQSILLHRSVQDQASGAESGAEVVVTGPSGRRIVFQESPDACYSVEPNPDFAVRATCYYSAPNEGRWVTPGATYDLLVRTGSGEEARGRTTVPGSFRVIGIRTSSLNDQPTAACALPPGTPLPVAWTPAAGAWGYLSPLTIYGLGAALPASFNAPDPMELLGVSVSAADTTLVLPGEFGVFERFDYNQDLMRSLQAGLPEGTEAHVVIAAADRNYINSVRGGNFNPSGQVRISSIVGDGVGVFGSLVPLAFSVDVRTTVGGLFPCLG